MRIFRSDAKAIEVILVISLGVLLLVAYLNEDIRGRLFSETSPVSGVIRAAGSLIRIGNPARKYGITPKTTTVELARMLSDMLISGSYDEKKAAIIVRELRKRSSFVLTGVIDNIHTVELVNDIDVEGEFSITLLVGKVERGEYFRDTIDIGAGYYASWLPFPVYPTHIRVNYRRGDEVRVFVEDDPDFGYILSGGFFGIEPREE